MNAERLHAIVAALRADLDATASVATMQQLRTSLRNQANAPQDATHQEQLTEAMQTLRNSLPSAASNNYPPSWVQTLEEFGIDTLLGQKLLDQVESVIAQNQFTISAAADRLDELTTEIEALDAAINELISGLSHLSIGAEELPPGQAEVGVLIPRLAVESELGRLGRELGELEAILLPFVELATGSRAPLIVSSVASTDFGVFVAMAPPAAAFVALAVDRVITTYKSVLEIRNLRQGLSDKGLSSEALQQIEDHVNQLMAEMIAPLADELVAQAESSDEGRNNELRTALQMSLNAIANRIDNGYNIDVRANGSGPADDADAAALQSILDKASALRFINRTGNPILSLPERVGENGGDSDDSEAGTSDSEPAEESVPTDDAK